VARTQRATHTWSKTEMSNLFKKYETNPQMEAEGVRIPIDGCVFICRRAGGGNRRYRAAMALHASARGDAVNSEDQDVAMSAEDEIVMQTFADAVVIGWENVDNRDDQPWEFTKENFLELMRACPEVWLRLRMEARDAQNYREKVVVEQGTALGNS
jgi:hypothetical protein